MEARTAISRPLKAVIIGAGNVASHLAPALEAAGAVEVMAVWSRTPEHAQALCSQLADAKAVSDLALLPNDADFYLVAVIDDMIPRIVKAMRPNGALWAHTSGTIAASVLAPLTPHYGVFYPLQTLSRGVAVNLAEAPFFIEGGDTPTLTRLKALAESISNKVYEADSTLRGKLHAAAVFACNFTNHLWAIADDLLRRDANVDISVLEPLMRETLRKALIAPPAQNQTGPARRGDKGVMERHLSLLNSHEAEIYKLLSKSIMDYYERN